MRQVTTMRALLEHKVTEQRSGIAATAADIGIAGLTQMERLLSSWALAPNDRTIVDVTVTTLASGAANLTSAVAFSGIGTGCC